MVGFKLSGGLCNTMSIIATAEYLGKTQNKDIVYPNVIPLFDHLEGSYVKHCKEYFTIFKDFDFFKNHNKNAVFARNVDWPFTYIPLLADDGVCYTGFFQSAKYFGNDFQFVQELFKPSKGVETMLCNVVKFPESQFMFEVSCSIHVRRGDYLQFSDYHPVQTMDYYDRAMDYVLQNDKRIKYFLIFSDDINWCKQNFVGSQYIFMSELTKKDYVDMYLMSYCKHNIIVNSSFSWWGAALNTDINKIVIAPEKWFGKDASHIDYSDIVPETWVKM